MAKKEGAGGANHVMTDAERWDGNMEDQKDVKDVRDVHLGHRQLNGMELN